MRSFALSTAHQTLTATTTYKMKRRGVQHAWEIENGCEGQGTHGTGIPVKDHQETRRGNMEMIISGQGYGPMAALVKYRGDFRSQKSAEFVMSCVTISFSRITRLELYISFRSFIMCLIQVLPTPLTPVFVNYMETGHIIFHVHL